MTITKLLSTTALVCASAAFSAPALAQSTTPPPCPANDPNCKPPATENEQDRATAESSAPGDAPEPEKLNPQSEVEIESGQSATDDDQQIVVTGSRIRRPNLESNVPITSLGQDEIFDNGDVNVGDALNDLPSLRSTFSQANSTRFIGTAGLNFLDLRGLGTTRTLVLVNNRRHITASPGDFRIDINTIPTDLIERVDVITGGSSAVYGSDAVAGVVNFVLKRDFDGIRLRGQGSVSSRGDRGIHFAALTAGKNFAEGRGNIATSLEYVHAETYTFAQRDDLTGALSGSFGFVATENTIGEPATGNGIADTTFLGGLRSTGISAGGLLTAAASAAQCRNDATLTAAQRLTAAQGTARCVNFGTPLGQPRTFTFDQAGNLNDTTPAMDLRPFGSGFSVGGGGSTNSETNQLAPGLDRYAANILAHFDVSEAAKFFVEGKYVHLRVLQAGQPSFFQGTFPGFFGGGRGIRCDNPFLTDQNLAQLRAVGRCTGTTAAALGAETLPLSRFNIDFGARGEINKRDTYRIVAGIQGDFNEDWNYEISGNYGRLETKLSSLNNLLLFDINGNQAGFLLASDAVRLPSGQIVCRVNSDAITTNDAPGCVPINVFGNGRPSQEALDFVNVTSTGEGKAEQYNAVAFVGGDLSQLFELPGGPIRFVVGGEYRKEKASQVFDALTASGGTFLNALQPFNPPSLVVKEAFGEVEFPILRDLPFAQELTITGAARYSDYNKGAGTAKNSFAYNVNGTYAPVPDIRLRANYSKSVRVPTLGDLFSPQSQNFAFVQDPCDVQFITGGPNRAANCAALGVPVGFRNEVTRSQTIGFTSGGNPLLEEETGKSLTIGTVITPRFLPGFSLTVDYFDIKVNNLIATLGAQAILNQCVDQPNINNAFCAQILGRDPTGNFLNPNNVLISGGVNFAKLTARGIDADVAYRRTFDNGHRLNMRGIATYTLERTNFVNPADPTFGDRQLSELGDPVFAANFSAAYGIGNFDVRYSLDYIGRQTIGAFETQNSFQGRPPTNPDAFPRVFYPDVFYHAIRASYKVNNNFRAYFGVDNIFDRKPPFNLSGAGAGSAIFDNVGRQFYAGAQVDF